MTGPRPLHRLFGLSWSDFFHGSDVSVELEMDLSRRQQFLDVVLIRKGSNPIPHPLPDGFEDLAAHNLVTFKSHQEALDGWALAELIGHGVNYRKQSGASPQDVLPESEVRLYAVCVRFPQTLASAGILQPVREGVFDVIFPAVATIRVIVVHRIPQAAHNAILHLFSARNDVVQYGRKHYPRRSTETSTLLLELFRSYGEDPEMSTQLQEFVRQSIDELLSELPPEELRKHLSPEERLKGLPPEELRKHLPPEERVKGLSLADRLKGLSAEDRRKALEELQREFGQGRSSESN